MEFTGTFYPIFSNTTQLIFSYSVYDEQFYGDENLICVASVSDLYYTVAPIFGNDEIRCEFSNLGTDTLYRCKIDDTGTGQSTTVLLMRTLAIEEEPCFTSSPALPTLLLSNTYVSSWSSDISGLNADLYGFKRYETNGDPIDTTIVGSYSEFIFASFTDLDSFSIAAFASKSCGFTESGLTAYSYVKTFSTISYIFSNTIGFSYSIDISDVSNVGNTSTFTYNNSLDLDYPELPVVGNSITSWLSYTSLGNISYSLTRIEASVGPLGGFNGETFAFSEYFRPVVAPTTPPPPPPPPTSDSTLEQALTVALISVFAVVIGFVIFMKFHGASSSTRTRL